jgi:DNA-binding GntR family transcriptional regulator
MVLTNHPRTNEEIAYDHLRAAIVNGELPVDCFLSQRDLAERAGVSVVTARAALRTLESDGLIESVPRWGVRIPSETPESITDRYYVREILEVAAVQRIVDLASPVHAATLRDLARACDEVAAQQPDNVELFAQRHFDYHHYIAECAGSPQLLAMLDRFHLRTSMLYNAKRGWGRGLDRVQHAKLTETILSGDRQAAEQAICQHVRRGLHHELEAIGTVDEVSPS